VRLICGLVRLDDVPAERSQVENMAAALGSPGLKSWVRSMALGPAALAIVEFSPSAPVSEGRSLPMGTDGGWLAADLRLDRPAALAARLGVSARLDAERLALEAVARWNEDVPDQMDGDFALAHWDPTQRTLLCARDALGVRPLCYSWQPGKWLAFASLPRGLHASGMMRAKADLVALGRITVDRLPSGPSTGFDGISWLEPGHSLLLKNGVVRLHRAYRPGEATVGRWRGTTADAAAELRTLLEEAVAERLPTEGRVAAHLSGGLDSSALTVIAARQLRRQGRRLLALSEVGRPEAAEGLLDERHYVDSVLAQEGDLDWREIHLPEAGDVCRPVDVDLPGTPMAGGGTQRTSWAAASAGAQLVISGAGGDEGATCNAVGLHAALFRQGCWGGLRRELRSWAKRNEVTVWQAAKGRVLAPLLPGWVDDWKRGLQGRPPAQRSANDLSLLCPPLARRVAAERDTDTGTPSSPRERIRILTRAYLGTRAANWAIQSSRAGVALTYPFKDRRVVDFALALPLDRLVQDGYTRQPFRNAMAGILPEELRLRDSKYLSSPEFPLLYASAKERLLAEVAELRHHGAAAAFADFVEVERAIRQMPDGEGAMAVARELNRTGAGWPPMRRAIAATRTLQIARFIQGLG
jgi:asparagine synthase (glutamine-hydrolysing)